MAGSRQGEDPSAVEKALGRDGYRRNVMMSVGLGDFALVEKIASPFTLSWWSRSDVFARGGAMVRGLAWRCAGFASSRVLGVWRA